METVTAPTPEPVRPAETRPQVQARAVATSLLKGLELLTVLARRPEGLPMALLVRKLQQPRTSILRMLATLEHYGLAAKKGRAWCATEQFYEWCSRDTHREIANRYRGAMQAIAVEVDELVGLGIGEAEGVRYIHWECGPQAGTIHPPRHDVYPLHCTAVGKLLLAQRSEVALDCRLQAEIEQARATGVAWSRRECWADEVAMAMWGGAPSPLTPVLFISWPWVRFTEAKAARALAIVRRELARLTR